MENSLGKSGSGDSPSLSERLLAFFCFPFLLSAAFYLIKFAPIYRLPARLGYYHLNRDLLLTPLLLLVAWLLLLWLGKRPSLQAALRRLFAKVLRNRLLLLAGLILIVTGFDAVRMFSAGPFYPFSCHDAKVNPDTFAYVFQARVFAEGKLWVPAAGPAFDTVMVVQHAGRMYGKYPPATSAVLAPAERLFHDPRPFTVLLPALAALLIYLAALELFSPAVALLAALLFLTSPETVRYGPIVMSYPVSMVAVALVLLALAKIAHARSRLWYVVLAATLAFEANCRPLDAVILCLALGLYALLLFVKSRKTQALALFATLGAATLAGGAIMMLYDRLLTGKALLPPYCLYAPLDREGFGMRGLLDMNPTFYYGWKEALGNVATVYKEFLFAFGLLGVLFLLAALAWALKRSAAKPVCVVFPVLVAGVGLYGLHWARHGIYSLAFLPPAVLVLAWFLARAFVSPSFRPFLLAFLLAQVFLFGPGLAAYTHLGPKATPAELQLMQSARHHPTLVFLAPQTIPVPGPHGESLPAKRRLGWPTLGLGGFIQSPHFDGPLVLALDRGPVANSALLKRYPGRRVYKEVLHISKSGFSVDLFPYSPDEALEKGNK